MSVAVHWMRARAPAWAIAALAVLLAFGLLGHRPIWDPDEGRYTNVALNMLDSGDWLEPRRQHEVGHWTKPPLVYWAIAGSAALFGAQAWALRLPAALSYLLCTLLVALIARRLAPGTQRRAALVHASFLMTASASQLITTDYLLTLCETLAMWGWVQARFGARRPRLWLLVFWLGLALAFLAKGPPALVPLAVVAVFEAGMPAARRGGVRHWQGALLFLLLALPWYVAVTYRVPGLLSYFVGEEVFRRVATDAFDRNGQWYGWLAVYVPTLLLGSLPWTWRWLVWWRGLPALYRTCRAGPAQREGAAAPLLVAAWILVPLLLFCLSRSRLPLYVLPLFVPMALAIAMQAPPRALSRMQIHGLLAWVALLLGLRIAVAGLDTHKDAAAWAAQIRARVEGPVDEVVFVDDMARYGLRATLGAQVEKISMDPLPPGQARFNPGYDEDLRQELLQSRYEGTVVWICKQRKWTLMQAHLRGFGYQGRRLGGLYYGRVIFRVERLPSALAPPDRDR